MTFTKKAIGEISLLVGFVLLGAIFDYRVAPVILAVPFFWFAGWLYSLKRSHGNFLGIVVVIMVASVFFEADNFASNLLQEVIEAQYSKVLPPSFIGAGNEFVEDLPIIFSR